MLQAHDVWKLFSYLKLPGFILQNSYIDVPLSCYFPVEVISSIPLQEILFSATLYNGLIQEFMFVFYFLSCFHLCVYIIVQLILTTWTSSGKDSFIQRSLSAPFIFERFSCAHTRAIGCTLFSHTLHIKQVI